MKKRSKYEVAFLLRLIYQTFTLFIIFELLMRQINQPIQNITHILRMTKQMQVPTMAMMASEGKSPEVLFWVGCAGSFDARAQRVTIAFCKILNEVGIDFAILGNEEMCTGDPARRAGNEFIFQMMAVQNINTLNTYNVKKIVATCPHCFNTLKNEYPALGGHYEVQHHSVFLQELINEGKLTVEGGEFRGKKITYHDSCYIGRANNIYEAPRSVLAALDADLVELKRCRTTGLCCGAGGAQMFKEDEPGDKRINSERAEEILETNATIVAANCPFCITMLQDGMKAKDKQDDVMVYDISEMIVKGNGW
jgi:heterodisulfide reductase subunit D